MPRALCQGYCGGYHNVEEMQRVGKHGERFCQQCANKVR